MEDIDEYIFGYVLLNDWSGCPAIDYVNDSEGRSRMGVCASRSILGEKLRNEYLSVGDYPRSACAGGDKTSPPRTPTASVSQSSERQTNVGHQTIRIPARYAHVSLGLL